MIKNKTKKVKSADLKLKKYSYEIIAKAIKLKKNKSYIIKCDNSHIMSSALRSTLVYYKINHMFDVCMRRNNCYISRV